MWGKSYGDEGWGLAAAGGGGPTYGLQDSKLPNMTNLAAGTYSLGTLTAPAGCAIMLSLYVTNEPGNITSIQDSNGNTYDTASPRVGNLNFGACVFWAPSPGAQVANNITMTIGTNGGANNTNIGGIIAAYGPVFSTASGAAMFDGSAFTNGYNGTSGAGTFFTTSHSNTICAGVFLPNNGDFTVSAPYAKIGAPNSYIYQVYRTVLAGTITNDSPVTVGDGGFYGGYNDVFRIIS